MSDKQEKGYRLSLYGFVSLVIKNDNVAREIVDALELYCRRNNQGIAVDGDRFDFVSLERVDE